MKIYRLPIEDRFRPAHQNFVWPPQNQLNGWDFGVEQDFDWWLDKHPELLTDKLSKADWAYAPIYFNRYYINNIDSDGHWGGGMEVLANLIDIIISQGAPVFTISEADIKWLEPQIGWENMVVFCSSRRDEYGGIDIPLLSAPRPLPDILPEKKWLASFMGNLMTDEIRKEMFRTLEWRKDCRIENANVPMDEFTRVMLESYIALSPRGQGAQSFRFYEAMQLGIAPLYISDQDCRPFKRWVNWSACSKYCSNYTDLSEIIEYLSHQIEYLKLMGDNAKDVYDLHLTYQKWCPYVINELERI